MFDNTAFVAGMVVAACAVLLIGLRAAATWSGDRQLGGKGQSRLFRYAARTGTVPTGARHEVWRGALEAMAARRDRSGKLSSGARGPIIGVIAGAVLLVWTTPTVALAVGVLAAATFVLLDRRVERRQTRLLAVLQQMG